MRRIAIITVRSVAIWPGKWSLNLSGHVKITLWETQCDPVIISIDCSFRHYPKRGCKQFALAYSGVIRTRSAKRRRLRRHASNPKRQLLHRLRRATCLWQYRSSRSESADACRRSPEARARTAYARPLRPNRGCEARGERASRLFQHLRLGPTRRRFSVQMTKARIWAAERGRIETPLLDSSSTKLPQM